MIDDSRRSARRQAVFLLYQRDVTGLSLAELEDNVVRDRGADLDLFTREVVDGVECRSNRSARAQHSAGGGV
jgi:hypothetical protein